MSSRHDGRRDDKADQSDRDYLNRAERDRVLVEDLDRWLTESSMGLRDETDNGPDESEYVAILRQIQSKRKRKYVADQTLSSGGGLRRRRVQSVNTPFDRGHGQSTNLGRRESRNVYSSDFWDGRVFESANGSSPPSYPIITLGESFDEEYINSESDQPYERWEALGLNDENGVGIDVSGSDDEDISKLRIGSSYPPSTSASGITAIQQARHQSPDDPIPTLGSGSSTQTFIQTAEKTLDFLLWAHEKYHKYKPLIDSATELMRLDDGEQGDPNSLETGQSGTQDCDQPPHGILGADMIPMSRLDSSGSAVEPPRMRQIRNNAASTTMKAQRLRLAPSKRVCYYLIATIVLGLTSSFALALWWSHSVGDVSAGFTVGSYVVAIIALLLAAAGVFHAPRCRCWETC
ncbi:hypothetical protein F5Y18DRAFT_434040 [Xylariaceae sp. FL1019]|nr:hypothetical protein F5Y18DRAFT_434040 [Xylariaceae sp. FL1019]